MATAGNAPSRRFQLRVLVCVLLLALLINADWARAALVSQLAADPCDSRLLKQARARVAATFGGVQSHPLVACQTRSLLGLAVSHGRTSFAPGLPAVVLLGPDGHNVDVAAHEWVHAELSARVGVLTRTFGLPTWFDEGLAMQVDARPDYNQQALAHLRASGQRLPELSELAHPGQFFSDDPQLGRLHYALARCVVAFWPVAQQPEQLLTWLSQRHWLRAFPVANFQAAEQGCHGGVQ